MKKAIAKTTTQAVKNYFESERGELTKEVLKSLALGGFVVASFALPGLPQIMKLFEPKDWRERDRLKKTLWSLEKMKYVKIYRKNGKDVVEITEKGRKKVLAYNLEDMEMPRSAKWDGIWRVIIFDIPELKKRVRRALSMQLSLIGCYPLQKSVYVTPFPCKKEIDFVSHYFLAETHIIVIEAKYITNQEKLRKHFKL